MKLEFEYGHGLMAANLPDSTDVFIPGETVADPPCLPQDWDSLYAATLNSLRNPIGTPPLKELAGPGWRRRTSCCCSPTACTPGPRCPR